MQFTNDLIEFRQRVLKALNESPLVRNFLDQTKLREVGLRHSILDTVADFVVRLLTQRTTGTRKGKDTRTRAKRAIKPTPETRERIELLDTLIELEEKRDEHGRTSQSWIIGDRTLTFRPPSKVHLLQGYRKELLPPPSTWLPLGNMNEPHRTVATLTEHFQHFTGEYRVHQIRALLDEALGIARTIIKRAEHKRLRQKYGDLEKERVPSAKDIWNVIQRDPLHIARRRLRQTGKPIHLR